MLLSETVLIIMGLLTVAMIAAGLCRNLPVPYTVVLVVVGMGLGELTRHWPAFAPLAQFHLRPDLVFFIFLPALIFESGFNLDARQLTKDLAPVLVLAVPALLVSTALVGLGLWWLLDLDPTIALLFGALISATDPVAVVALFKELGAPLRMTVLVEGESLLNDATAIVVFGILLGIALEGGGLTAAGAGLAVFDFLEVFLGGTVVGIAIGLLVSEALYRLHSTRSAILTWSIVMAYASFIIAEHVLHVSGVMASGSAAVTLGVFGVTRMSREATAAVAETWELIALLCNSLLFLLVGLSVEPAGLAANGGPILVAVVLVLAARAAGVYSLVPVTTRLFALPRVTLGERHIMWWGGLKGGLAIAIALSIPAELPGRQLLLDLTLGVVLFTLLVNASSIRPLMSRLGLDTLTDDERSEINQSLENAGRRAGALLEQFRVAEVLSKTSHVRIRKKLVDILESERLPVRHGQATREVYLSTLGQEMEELKRIYELGVINQYTFLEFRNILQRDREVHSAVVEGPVQVAPAGPSLFMRIEMALLRWLREHDWAAGFLSRYQNLRLAQHLQHNIAGILICESVLEMLSARASLDAGERESVTRLFRNRLARRRERVRVVREEFPDFYQGFESRLFTSVALNCARHSANNEYQHGEIGAKPLTLIERRLYAALGDLPPIGQPVPSLSPRELMEMVPLLSGLSEEALEAVAARAHPVTFLPGDIVIGEGEKGDALYIITRGRASVYKSAGADDPILLGELGEGDFLGEMALLGDQMRTATVKTRTPSTLLRLTRRDILSLAEQYPEIGKRLESARQERAGR